MGLWGAGQDPKREQPAPVDCWREALRQNEDEDWCQLWFWVYRGAVGGRPLLGWLGWVGRDFLTAGAIEIGPGAGSAGNRDYDVNVMSLHVLLSPGQRHNRSGTETAFN